MSALPLPRQLTYDMYDPFPGSRDETRRISIYSLSLLAVFVAAVVFTVYVALAMKPWASEGDTTEPSVDAAAPAAAGPTTAATEQPAAAP